MSDQPFEIQLVSRKKGKLIAHNSENEMDILLAHNSENEMDILLAQLEDAQEAFNKAKDVWTFHKNISATHATNVINRKGTTT